MVYPIETIFAEKLETVLSKGSKNSRMKDFHDLFLLIRNEKLQISKKLHKNIQKTFENRGTILNSIQFDEAGHKVLQQLWTAHLQGLGDVAKALDLPENIREVMDILNRSLA